MKDGYIAWNVAADVARKVPRPLVFTNGCFDILHVGHVRYLQQARQQGAALWVGLNSDASVQRLKGPHRPIVPAEERAEMLLALEAVDMVTVFTQDTPLELIHLVHPDILVKGGDWAVQDIVGGPEVMAWGGEVRSLAFVDGRSTSAIVDHIRAEVVAK